jgi:hypothetical protein
MKNPRAPISTTILRVGILLYPSFFIMDWFVYPGHKIAMLIIRVSITLFLIAAQAVFPRIRDKYKYPALMVCFLVVSFSLSLLCLISGDGFNSPYILGILQMILLTTLFRRESEWEYGGMIAEIVGQHFLLLSFGPVSLRGVLINVFGIVVFAVVAIVAHHLINEVAKENKKLKGILPICARCKKIRDDEGYWEEVATYIRDHSEAEFTHGICPECMAELYPEFKPEKKET